MAFDALLGGTALKILHQLTRPMLVIRVQLVQDQPPTCKADCLDLARPVLYATDFSDTSQRAFAYVEKMVEGGVASVTLIHVQDRSRIEKHLKDRLDEFNNIDTVGLEMLKNALMKKGAKDIKIVLTYGMPVEEILNTAKKDNYSLIVMGAQGRGLVKEVFLGSVSGNVVRHASHPVLLIPALK